MSRKLTAISFSLLFLTFLSTPLIITAIDSTVDVSIFYGSAEEEESEKEQEKNLEILLAEAGDMSKLSKFHRKDQYLGYQFRDYLNPYLDFISPPPEQNIL
ncbi:MAG: hypothetical protein KJO41_05240 [Bacteroidia bacterium]|nr:hypothetical protein [Bacteroidia bacterium]NND24563.1 hypothetical protein [Flavobacteriaceae bacterium]MBT8278386.1 hypothetical protein [Bacteroidia bacterium]NNK60587.1 hypothetical protein [Flavobacteriaceae bacterium]NNL31765.1 hypothetical protein [Flavobacteriaceae bacterium]